MNIEHKTQTESDRSSKPLQQLLQQVVVKLFDAPTNKKNEAVNHALSEISKAMGVERCHFALINPETKQLFWVSEGVNNGIAPNIADVKSFEPASYYWLLDFLAENDYLSINNLETDLPEEAVFVKNTFSDLGYNFSLFVPLRKVKALVGWIGFGNEKAPIEWQIEDLQNLQAICTYLYTAVTRYKSIKTIKANANILEEAEKLAQMGSWEFDLKSRRLRASNQLKRILEVTPGDSTLKLSSIVRQLGLPNWKPFRKHFDELFQSGNETASICHLNIAGSPRYFRTLSKIHKSKKGIPIKLTGVVLDITTQKLVDEELASSRKKQELIFKNIRDYLTLYKVTGAGKYLIDSFNDAAFELQKLFVKDISREDIQGRDLKEYLIEVIGLPEEYVIEKIKRMDQVVRTHEPMVREEEVPRPDGSSLFLQSRITPIIEDGKVNFLLSSGHDYTELRLTERRLLEKDQEYRLALQASRLGFYKWNLAEENIFLDKGYSEILGLGSKATRVSITFIENRLTKRSFARLKPIIERLRAGDENNSIIETEAEYLTPTGVRHLYCTGMILRKKEYPAGMLLGFVNDITDKKQAEARLKESEARWRTLHEIASDAIVVIENEVIVECNRAALDVFGCLSKDEIIGKSASSFCPEQQPDGKPSREKWEALSQKAIEGGNPKFYWNHIQADGTPFDAEVSLSAIQLQGQLVIQAIIRDITERTKMVQALRESEEKYRSLVESSLQGILILVDEKVRYFNKAITDMMGYSSEELYKMNEDNLLALAHPQDREELDLFRKQKIDKPYLLEFRFRRKDGNYRWVKCQVGKMSFSEPSPFVLTAIDITDQKKAHEMALISATESEDRERQRIAAELHDGLGQLLTSAVLNLGAINEAINSLDEKVRTNYQSALKAIKTALHETRIISHNLMPKAIKDFGYALAVEQLITGLKDNSGIQLSFFTNFRDGRLSPMLERNLYRITQEAVTNIIKHARAQSGVVQLMKYPEMLILTIEDDGVGFEPSAVNSKNHMGLRNIAIRAESMGATLDIDTSPGHGTVIAIQIPLIHE